MARVRNVRMDGVETMSFQPGPLLTTSTATATDDILRKREHLVCPTPELGVLCRKTKKKSFKLGQYKQKENK